LQDGKKSKFTVDQALSLPKFNLLWSILINTQKKDVRAIGKRDICIILAAILDIKD
jgi:hypothetical protein